MLELIIFVWMSMSQVLIKCNNHRLSVCVTVWVSSVKQWIKLCGLTAECSWLRLINPWKYAKLQRRILKFIHQNHLLVLKLILVKVRFIGNEFVGGKDSFASKDKKASVRLTWSNCLQSNKKINFLKLLSQCCKYIINGDRHLLSRNTLCFCWSWEVEHCLLFVSGFSRK